VAYLFSLRGFIALPALMSQLLDVLFCATLRRRQLSWRMRSSVAPLALVRPLLTKLWLTVLVSHTRTLQANTTDVTNYLHFANVDLGRSLVHEIKVMVAPQLLVLVAVV
jgi:hypothetical protein